MNKEYVQRLEAAVEGAERRVGEVLSLVHEPDRSGYPMRSAPGLHVPRLNLANYLTGASQPPPAVARLNLGFDWGMLLNDKLSDCGEAMSIHGDEAFHLDAGTPVPPYADQDAEDWYGTVAGYVPGDPATDRGTDNSVLVQKWESVGIPCNATGTRSKIVASLFVDPTDVMLTKIGIWEFVVLFRAYGLPITAQDQTTWRVSDNSLQGDAAVASWGYHDIPHIAYNRRGPITVTWGAEKQVTWDFDETYGAGGFVVVTEDQLNNVGVSPSGVNWSKLNADLAQLPSVPAS